MTEPAGELVARIAGLSVVAEVWQTFGVGVEPSFDVHLNRAGVRGGSDTHQRYVDALHAAAELAVRDLTVNDAIVPESLEYLVNVGPPVCGDCGEPMERKGAGYRCPNQAAHA